MTERDSALVGSVEFGNLRDLVERQQPIQPGTFAYAALANVIAALSAEPIQAQGLATDDELPRLRQTVEYLTGVPPQPGVINDWRAPQVDAAILRCRERGDTETAHIIAQMRLAYRQRDNEAFEALTTTTTTTTLTVQKQRDALAKFANAAKRIDYYDGEQYDAPLYAVRRGGAMRELLDGIDGDSLTVADLRHARVIHDSTKNGES